MYPVKVTPWAAKKNAEWKRKKESKDFAYKAVGDKIIIGRSSFLKSDAILTYDDWKRRAIDCFRKADSYTGFRALRWNVLALQIAIWMDMKMYVHPTKNYDRNLKEYYETLAKIYYN